MDVKDNYDLSVDTVSHPYLWVPHLGMQLQMENVQKTKVTLWLTCAR